MGRFYKTASANPLDYMYKANIPLMERVVEANDQFIDQNVAGLSKLDQLASYNHLIGDAEDAQKVTETYRKKVDELTKAIQKDPASWRKQLDPIRNLSQELQRDYESGTISKHQYNYNQRKKAFDAVDKQVELYHTSGGTKGVDPIRAAAYKRDWDSKFTKTGYNPTTGEYNVYKGGSVMDNIDVKKVLADGLDKIKADKSHQYREDEYGNGWFFNKVTKKEEMITPEKILRVATDNINPNLMQYLKADQDVGLISGVYDDKGNFIQPYSYNKVPLSPEEEANIESFQASINAIKNPALRKQQQEIFNAQVAQRRQERVLEWSNKSYLAPYLRGLVDTYSYRSVESGNDLSNNSKGSTIYTQGQVNARHASTLNQQKELAIMRENGIQKRFDDRLAFDKWKHENPISKSSSKTGSSSKKTSKEEELPKETGISRVVTNSFEDWTVKTADNKVVPVLSNEGLVTEIENKKRELGQVDTRLKEIDKILSGNPAPAIKSQLTAEKANLTAKQKIVTGELADRRHWYKTALDAALNNDPSAGEVGLKPEEINLYKKFEGDRDGSKYRKRIENITAALKAANAAMPGKPGVTPTKDKSLTDLNKEYYEKTRALQKELYDAREEWSQYQSAKARVDKARDNILASLRKDVIDNDGIQLGTDDSKAVANILFANTRGFNLFNNRGEKSSLDLEGDGISLFDSKGDNYKLSFDDNSLVDYINRYNVKVNVNKIANTTKIGSGNAVAEVTFEDNTGGIPKGKTYYIEMTPETQKALGNKFKTHKNPDVVNIANKFLDDEGNNLRNQLMRPNASSVGGEDGEYKIFATDPDGDRMELTVVRYPGGKLFVKNQNGQPFPNGTALAGNFNGIEDFIDNFKKMKELALQSK